jgi:hypothetical protein
LGVARIPGALLRCFGGLFEEDWRGLDKCGVLRDLRATEKEWEDGLDVSAKIVGELVLERVAGDPGLWGLDWKLEMRADFLRVPEERDDGSSLGAVWKPEVPVSGVNARVDHCLLLHAIEPGEIRDGREEGFHLAVVVALEDEIVDGDVVGVLEDGGVVLGGPGSTADVDFGLDGMGVAGLLADGGDEALEGGVIRFGLALPFDIRVGLARHVFNEELVAVPECDGNIEEEVHEFEGALVVDAKHFVLAGRVPREREACLFVVVFEHALLRVGTGVPFAKRREFEAGLFLCAQFGHEGSGWTGVGGSPRSG